jgi:hypothetical protein
MVWGLQGGLIAAKLDGVLEDGSWGNLMIPSLAALIVLVRLIIFFCWKECAFRSQCVYSVHWTSQSRRDLPAAQCNCCCNLVIVTLLYNKFCANRVRCDCFNV